MTLTKIKDFILSYEVVFFMVFVGLGWLILYLMYMLFTVLVL